MNRRFKKFCLWALPFLVVSVAFFYAKWKTDNPTPTKLDLEVRKRFVEAKDATFKNEFQSQPLYLYRLSQTEREEIASHLWMGEKPGISTRKEIGLNLSNRGNSESIQMYSSNDNVYQSKSRGEVKTYGIHPATSRFIWKWLKEHTQVEGKLGLYDD